jgi:U4/U6.U5 tri-snRNP-associated protein 1
MAAKLADEDKTEDGLVLTGTIEFCRGIQQVEEPAAKPKPAAVEMEVDEDQPVDEPQEAEDGSSSEEDDDGFAQERMLGRGLGGALDMMRNRGSLKDVNEAVLGRNDDEKNVNVNEPNEAVFFDEEKTKKINARLEYRDKFGRLLSQKEAFRQLSYGFHGKGPGKGKIESRQRKIAEAQRLKKVAQAGETPTTLLALDIAQKNPTSTHGDWRFGYLRFST